MLRRSNRLAKRRNHEENEKEREAEFQKESVLSILLHHLKGDTAKRLSRSTRMKRLCVDSSMIIEPNAFFATIARSTTMTSFEIHGDSCADGFMHLARCSTLTELGLRYTDVDDDIVVAFTRLPHLRKLNLQGTKVTDRGIVALAAKNRIQELNICCTKSGNGAASALAVCTSLASLVTGRNGMTLRGLRSLSESSTITFLDLRTPEPTEGRHSEFYTDIAHMGPTQAKILASFRSLETLDIRDFLVVDRVAWQELCSLTTVKSLMIYAACEDFVPNLLQNESLLYFEETVHNGRYHTPQNKVVADALKARRASKLYDFLVDLPKLRCIPTELLRSIVEYAID